MKQQESKQAGFALLTVLMVVALVAIIAAELVYQQALNIQRSANMLHQAQSSAVSWGLEAWIKKGLKLDAEQNQVDHLNEEWARPMPPVPFEDGEISGQLFDRQGLLNLNNLQETDKTKRELWQGMFRRYLQLKELDPLLEGAVTDWIDADSNLGQNGAESDTYLLKLPAYRAGNQKLVILQELGLVKGFNEQIIAAIQPDITVLPIITKINVNTAPANVLASMATWMDINIANSWVESRKQAPADKVETFRTFVKNQAGVSDDDLNRTLPADFLTVTSDFFYLKGLAAYGESKMAISAVFFRKGKTQVNLVQRWVGASDE